MEIGARSSDRSMKLRQGNSSRLRAEANAFIIFLEDVLHVHETGSSCG